MDKPAIGGVIIGCRLTVSDHIDETVKIFDINMNDEDRKLIQDAVNKGRGLKVNLLMNIEELSCDLI